jgi:hypothetical protein
VLFGFLLNITNLLRQLLERVFISAVLHLEVWGEQSAVGLTILVIRLLPCCLLPAGAAWDAMAVV